VTYRFLTLLIEVYIQGATVRIVPDSRPGESVPLAAKAVNEKWVDSKYIFDSGIQGRLQDAGHRVALSDDDKLSRRIDLEGWEIVLEPDERVALTKFRLQTRPRNQTLIKKRGG